MKIEMNDQLQQNARNIIQKYTDMTRKLRALPKKAAFTDNFVSMYNPLVLQRSPFAEFVFHTAYVCTRPLDKGMMCKLSNLKHWALKFEGNERLMTVGWYATNESKRGQLQIQILCNKQNMTLKMQSSLINDNNSDNDDGKEEQLNMFPPLMSSYSIKHNRHKNIHSSATVAKYEWFYPNIHRRIFWYWWSAQSENEWCRQRWTVLKVFDLKKTGRAVTGKYIGQLLNRWRNSTYNGQQLINYDNTTNNCQHFVRDIFAAFDLEMAKDLNSSLDASLAVGILPASKYADHFDQDLRAAVMAHKLHTDVSAQVLRKVKISEWSKEECAYWVMNIADAYKIYGEMFIHEGIDGKDLIGLNDMKLLQIGVEKELHRGKILSAIQRKVGEEEKCCIL